MIVGRSATLEWECWILVSMTVGLYPPSPAEANRIVVCTSLNQIVVFPDSSGVVVSALCMLRILEP